MSSLVVITGPPGAGKSVTARALVSRFEPGVLVDGDAFFGFVASGAVPPWLPEAGDQNEVVIRSAASAAGQFAVGGYATVFDGVVGPWFLPAFLGAAGLDSVHYAVLMPPLEECLTRVATRHGHAFRDEEATRHMYREFATAELEGRHVVRAQLDGVEIVAGRIAAAIETGALAYPNPRTGWA